MHFVITDINYMTYDLAKEIVGRQGNEDRELPDDTIIVFEAFAKTKPTEIEDGLFIGEAWCRAHILCDCGETHVISSKTSIRKQTKNIFDEHPEYIHRVIDADDNVLVVNFLYRVDPSEGNEGYSMFSFRRPDGKIESSMMLNFSEKTEEEIQNIIKELNSVIKIDSVEMPKPKAKRKNK